jgi:hypothetical protein
MGDTKSKKHLIGVLGSSQCQAWKLPGRNVKKSFSFNPFGNNRKG